MTEAEIKAFYLGRQQEAQAMIDLLNAINRRQDATWAMPTSSNAEKALETAFHGTLEAPQSIPWADHEASTKAITNRFRGHVDKERHKRQTAEKALETAQSQITTLRTELDELKETHLRMCATLRECVQKHHLGLGGEHLDTLVVQRIEAQTAAIQEAQSIIAELMLLGSLELPYRRSAALLRAGEVNVHLQTFLPTAATPSASESKERKCPECQRSGPDIPFHLDTGLCARCHHRQQRKRHPSE